MSGFEVINSSDAVIINADQKHTIFNSIYTMTTMPVGDYDFNTAFGNFNQLGPAIPGHYITDGYLYWIQFTKTNGWGYPSFAYFTPSSVRVIRTSRTMTHQSGYLDVFDGSGNLVWSAKSASTMPRVRGILTSSPTVDLTGKIVSVTPGFNPFFLWNACVGEISDDGASPIGYSGNLMRWTGSQLQMSWIRTNSQQAYLDIFRGRGGLKVPYAQFLAYP